MFIFFFNDTAPTEIYTRPYTLSLHDALPISEQIVRDANAKLSSSQQIRGWTIWPDAEFPTTPTQKVKKREIVERLLAIGRGEPATVAAAGATRELSDVERIVMQVANVPADRVHAEAQLSQDIG